MGETKDELGKGGGKTVKEHYGLITLSTDFGLEDPYVGVMKGVILGINPQVRLVDLTHGLSQHRLREAAFMLQGAFGYFPSGTIHLVVVDPGVGGDRRIIAVQDPKGCWIGPDNGILTLVLQGHPQAKTFTLTRQEYFLKEISATFHGRDIMAPAAAHLSLGLPLSELGEVIDDPLLLEFPEPQLTPDRIIGQVLWADHFGNLITNIRKEMIHRLDPRGRWGVKIEAMTIGNVRSTYTDVPPGALLALIGSMGYLEIACNQGRAAERLGYRPDKVLPVEVFLSEGGVAG